jgi:hypothetical protein
VERAFETLRSENGKDVRSDFIKMSFPGDAEVRPDKLKNLIYLYVHYQSPSKAAKPLLEKASKYWPSFDKVNWTKPNLKNELDQLSKVNFSKNCLIDWVIKYLQLFSSHC